MCCPLEGIAYSYEQHGTICSVYPKDLRSKIQIFFQRIEFLEKGAELFDETFHLLNRVFKAKCSVPIFQLLSETHHAAHQLEHVFHSFCFIGDLCRLDNWMNNSRKFPSFLDCLSRVCHATAHLFATLSFLKDLKIIQSKKLSSALRFQHLISASGYGVETTRLIWNRVYKKEVNKNFKSDLCIHLGGFVYESLSFVKDVTNTSRLFNQMTAIAGIIHAFSIIWRLSHQKIIASPAHSHFHHH